MAEKKDRSSRYAKTPIVVVQDRSGRNVELRALREIPVRGAQFSLTPTQDDRLDMLAFRFYRDPLVFWRLCDANDEMDPQDVVMPGEPIPIPPAN